MSCLPNAPFQKHQWQRWTQARRLQLRGQPRLERCRSGSAAPSVFPFHPRPTEAGRENRTRMKFSLDRRPVARQRAWSYAYAQVRPARRVSPRRQGSTRRRFPPRSAGSRGKGRCGNRSGRPCCRARAPRRRACRGFRGGSDFAGCGQEGLLGQANHANLHRMIICRHDGAVCQPGQEGGRIQPRRPNKLPQARPLPRFCQNLVLNPLPGKAVSCSISRWGPLMARHFALI